MRNLLLVVSVVLSCTSQALYVWQIWKGETKPPFATRCALAIAMLLNALSIHRAHGNPGAQAFADASFLQALITTIQSFKYTKRGPNRFDIGCFAVSAIGSFLLWLTNDPTTGMAMAIVADLVAYLPYFRNAWIRPEPKVWRSFVLSGAAAGVSLAYAFLYFPPGTTFGYQIYILVVDGGFILFNARTTVQNTPLGSAAVK